MNKEKKIRETKILVHELESSEIVLKQSLAVITSRKNALQKELDSLGASSSKNIGKIDSLTEKQTLSILASLTK